MSIDWSKAEDGQSLRRISVISDKPYVSIGAGRIYLNAEVSSFFGQEIEWGLIYIDEPNSIVAIKPLKNKNPKALPIRKSGGKNVNSSSREINSKALVREILGVASSTTRRYEAEWSDEHSCIMIYLDKEIT